MAKGAEAYYSFDVALRLDESGRYTGEIRDLDAFCTMGVDDKGAFVKDKPGEPDWVFLEGISGACGGKDGWVWNGGALRIE